MSVMTYAGIKIIGNIGKIEQKASPGGKDIFEFSIAHNFGRAEEKSTVWFEGAFWEQQGQMFNNMCKVGSSVYIEGDFEQQTWRDKEGDLHFKNVIKPRLWRLLANGKEKQESLEEDPYQ